MMEKYTRLELFELLVKGELEDGQKFEDEDGNIAVVKAVEGVYKQLVWEHSNEVLQLIHFEDEYFTPYEEKIAVELTQEQINTIYLLANHADDSDLMEFDDYNQYNTASTWDVYHTFRCLAKTKRSGE